MAADGTPDLAAVRLGEEIERLRVARKWTRTQLVVRVWNEQEADDPYYDRITEAWLSRLETGRAVKIPRQTIEAFCRALGCTAQEHARVLLYADRNPLSSATDTPSRTAEVLNATMAVLHAEADDILSNLLAQRRAEDLDDQELLELVAKALDMVRKVRVA